MEGVRNGDAGGWECEIKGDGNKYMEGAAYVCTSFTVWVFGGMV